MKINVKQQSVQKIKANMLVVGIFEDNKILSQVAKDLDDELNLLVSDYLIKKQHFQGKYLENLVLHTLGQSQIDKILFIGLGKVDDFNHNKVREIGAKIHSIANNDEQNKHIAIELFGVDKMLIEPKLFARSLTEGIVLDSFTFNKYKSKKNDENIDTIDIISVGSKCLDELKDGVKFGMLMANSQNFARTLTMEPAQFITPTKFANVAQELAKSSDSIECKVYSKAEIEKMKMNAFLAVGKGSIEEPKLVHLKYTCKKPRKKIALIGKGITFDSGGMDLKPPASMLNMKDDMSGASIALGVMNAISHIKPDIELHVITALCENMISGKAYKPGDILTAKNGKTIEVDNTDAEGRITLADALCYADELNVDEIIDIATLTGACVVALGNNISGVMGRNQENINKLVETANFCGEYLWQLPMYDFMQELLKSDVADMKNTGSRNGGASAAGQFLSNFVKNKNWIHIDIAGTALIDKPFKELQKGATGICVRTLTNYILS